MQRKLGFFIISILLVSIHAKSQMGLTQDSLIKNGKLIFQITVPKGSTTYSTPANLEGYNLQLIGSDNLSVISKAGKVFSPLNDCTIVLLYKAEKLSGNTLMEISVPVKVQGQFTNQG